MTAGAPLALPRPAVQAHLNARGAAVQLREAPHGRCLVATGPLPAGSVVLRCEAFASVLRPQHWGERCNACLRRPADDDGTPPRRLLCCGKCKRQYYCDRQCQLAEWPDHKRECKRLQAAEQALPPDALADGLLLGRVMRAGADPLEMLAASGGGGGTDATLHATRADVAAMAWHSEDLAAVSKLAMITGPRGSTPLYAADDVAAPKPTDATAERAAAELLCQFQCNNFGVATELLAAVGKGVFPAGALLNHSCAPNCVLSYSLGETEASDPPRRRRPVMECRTLRPVAAGEELCHNFIDLAAPTAERQATLEQAYHFTCDCTRCTSPAGKLADGHFRAPHPDYAGPKKVKERDRLLKQATRLFAQAEQCESSGLDEEEKLVRKAVALRRKVSHPLSLDVYEGNATAYKLALAAGDLDAALADCTRMVAFLQMAYAHIPSHPMLGIQLYTLGNLRGELATSDVDRAAAVAELREAWKGLAVCFGADHCFVQELDGLAGVYMRGGSASSPVAQEPAPESAPQQPTLTVPPPSAQPPKDGSKLEQAATVPGPEGAPGPSKRSLKKQAKLARIKSAKIAAGGSGVSGKTPWRDAAPKLPGGPSKDTGALAVQCTNDESIVSKRSAVRAGYYTDDYVRHFVGKVVRHPCSPQLHVLHVQGLTERLVV